MELAVRPLPGEIHGRKFYDLDRNGFEDIGEPGLPDWTIYLDLNNNGSLDAEEPSTLTGSSGAYSFTDLEPFTTYTVAEIQQQYWVQTYPALVDGGTWTVEIGAGTLARDIDFGNYYSGPGGVDVDAIDGVLYRDGNANGRRDSGEQGLENWTVFLDTNDNGIWDDPAEESRLTDAAGGYSFTGVSPDSYNVRAVVQTDWTQTTPLENRLAATPFGEGSFDQAQAVATGDFDGDGDLDLAVTHGEYVSLMRNLGDGTFEIWPGQEIRVGSGAGTLVADDFNHDGKLDLAVVSFNDSKLSVLLNQGVALTPFGPVAQTGIGSLPQSVTAGQFNDDNGDGQVDSADHLDLAIAHRNGYSAVYVNDNQVSILLGVVDGSFQPAIYVAAGNSPVSIITGQFNDDNSDGQINQLDALDLAVANFDSADVSILINDRTGSFDVGLSVPAGNGPISLVSGDFDGDGDLDLAVANLMDGNVSILLNIGNGSFVRLPESLPAGVGPQTLVAADLEGDGDVDLIVTNNTAEHLGILRNLTNPASGEIQFAPLESYGVADLLTGTIFAGNNSGQAGLVIIPQIAQFGTTTSSGTVAADGLLATVTIDTTGFFATSSGNPWTLMLKPTLAGNSSFPGVTTTIVNGTIAIEGNQAPTDISLNGTAVAENQPVGTPVGTLSTTDPDAGDFFSYGLVAGSGDTDNGSFLIVDDQLQTNAAFDYEAKSSYAIRVRSEDQDGLGVEEVFAITVTGVNESPTADAGGLYWVAEGGNVTLDGSGSSDPEQLGGTLAYAWDFDGDGEYDDATGIAPTFSAVGLDGPSSVTVALRVTDDDGAADTATADLVVDNAEPLVRVDGAPVNSPEGTSIYLTGMVTDPGLNDTHTHAWLATKDGNAYSSGNAVDFEFTPDDDGGYVVTLTVTDDDGGIGTDTVTIAAANVPPGVVLDGAPEIATAGDDVFLSTTVTDPGSADTHAYEWEVTRNGAAYISGSESEMVFRPSASGTYVATVTVRDDDGGEAVDGAAILVEEGLGTVDSLEIVGLNPSAGTLFYRLETAHQGRLTLEAEFDDSAGNVEVRLLDQGRHALLATSAGVNGTARIDWEVAAGQTYSLEVLGTADRVDLRIVNLLHQEGTTLTVSGTAGDDLFGFSASSSRTVTINGVEYKFDDEEVNSVTFDGGGGYDIVVLEDSEGDETLTAEATHAVFSNADQATGFSVEVDGFEELHAYAKSGGHDVAYLYDSEANDKFKAEPAENYAKMYGGRMYNRVKFFDVVEAFSSGQNDLARLFDTAGNEVFAGRKDLSRLSSGVFDVAVHNFRRVIAYAGLGGYDEATLTDSPLDDEFHGKAHKSEIFDADTNGAAYRITARRFDKVDAAADTEAGGYDRAKLWETARDDLFTADANWARLATRKSQLETLYELVAFEFVRVRNSSGGRDTAQVGDLLQFDLALGEGWEQP